MSKKKKESASAIEAEVQQSMDAAVDGQSGEEHDKAAAKKVKKDKKRREKNGLVDTFATGMAVDANGVDGQMASQADASQIQVRRHVCATSCTATDVCILVRIPLERLIISNPAWTARIQRRQVRKQGPQEAQSHGRR